jgi:hypothetical protein
MPLSYKESPRPVKTPVNGTYCIVRIVFFVVSQTNNGYMWWLNSKSNVTYKHFKNFYTSSNRYTCGTIDTGEASSCCETAGFS